LALKVVETIDTGDYNVNVIARKLFRLLTNISVIGYLWSNIHKYPITEILVSKRNNLRAITLT